MNTRLDAAIVDMKLAVTRPSSKMKQHTQILYHSMSTHALDLFFEWRIVLVQFIEEFIYECIVY